MFGVCATDWLLFRNVGLNLQGDFKSKGKNLVYPIYKWNSTGIFAKIYIFQIVSNDFYNAISLYFSKVVFFDI